MQSKTGLLTMTKAFIEYIKLTNGCETAKLKSYRFSEKLKPRNFKKIYENQFVGCWGRFPLGWQYNWVT